VRPQDRHIFVVTSGSGGSRRFMCSTTYARSAIDFAAIFTMAARGWLISPERILLLTAGEASARVSTARAYCPARSMVACAAPISLAIRVDVFPSASRAVVLGFIPGTAALAVLND